MTALFSVTPLESPSWAHVCVVCLAQVSVLPAGQSACLHGIYTLMHISTADGCGSMWYSAFVPLNVPPQSDGSRRAWRDKKSPNKLQSAQLRQQEGQREKTQDTFCASHFLFLKAERKMGGIREVAGQGQETIRDKNEEKTSKSRWCSSCSFQ